MHITTHFTLLYLFQFGETEPEPSQIEGLSATARALLLQSNRYADILENHLLSIYGRIVTPVSKRAP